MYRAVWRMLTAYQMSAGLCPRFFFSLCVSVPFYQVVRMCRQAAQSYVCRVNIHFFIPRHTKWRGIMLYPPNRLSVPPSVSVSFPVSNLSNFWLIFFKLCIDIDNGEEWFGIANWLNSFINNRVMALDWCKNVFLLNIVRTNGLILIELCICIGIYKFHVVSNARYVLVNFNRVVALDRRQNFVYAQYLVN